MYEPEIFNSRELQITNGRELTKTGQTERSELERKKVTKVLAAKVPRYDKRAHVDCPDHVHWGS